MISRDDSASSDTAVEEARASVDAPARALDIARGEGAPPLPFDVSPIPAEPSGAEGAPNQPSPNEQPILVGESTPAGTPLLPLDEPPPPVDKPERLVLEDAVTALFHDDFEAGDPGSIEGPAAGAVSRSAPTPSVAPPVIRRVVAPVTGGEARAVIQLQLVIEIKVGPIQISVEGGSRAGRR